MKYYLREKIGFPELFVGRKKEMAFFLKWIDDIKKEKSKSTAILARRKMGKSAIMERLYCPSSPLDFKLINDYKMLAPNKIVNLAEY